MASPTTIDLPDDLRAFAEECVRTGKNTSIADVVREALEAKKRQALSDALEAGLTELDAGIGVEQSVDELMAEVRAEAGLATPCRDGARAAVARSPSSPISRSARATS